MPKLNNRVPSYCHHKATGQAYVRLDGRDFYLGMWNTQASRNEYNRLIAEWLSAGRRVKTNPSDATVGEVVLAYVKHAQNYYRTPEGKPTGALERIVRELRPLTRLYKDELAINFGPVALDAVRSAMIEMGWVRTSINHAVSTIRQCFRWGVSRELVPGSIIERLQSLRGLEAGRSAAKEAEKVTAVPAAVVDATLVFLQPTLATAVRIQMLTAMRGGELLSMRTADIDRSGPVWRYLPRHHKTRHHGQKRVIFIGPKAQELLLPLLKLDGEAFIFSPADSERLRLETRHADRTTPLNQGNRPGSNRVKRRRRSVGEQYTVKAYRRAVARAADLADAWEKGGRVIDNKERLIERWHPHRLRHSAATDLRETHGIEAASVILGHRTLRATEVYAAQSEKKAEQVMRLIG